MRKSVKTHFPIRNIENGVIETKEGKLCKVLEVYPINFALKSFSEQESILYQYKNFLNTCNFDIQILVQSRKKDLDNHILQIEKNIEKEKNEKLVNLMREYINMIKNEVLKFAITKRFFIIFSSEVLSKNLTREQALSDLQEKTLKIKNTLSGCGNDVNEFNKNNKELVNIIYSYMNPVTSEIQRYKEFNYEYKY